MLSAGPLVIAAVAAAFAVLALAWLAVGVPQATAFFGFLAVLYLVIWFARRARRRSRPATDLRYSTPRLLPPDDVVVVRRGSVAPETESERRAAWGDR